MRIFLNILLLLIIHQFVNAQAVPPDTIPDITRDTVDVPTEKIPVLADTIQYNEIEIIKTASGKDSAVVKKKTHSPRQATIRSLILPGWGQAYNKKYWKIPIVYAGIGVPIYLYIDNKQWYNRTRYALSIVSNDRTDPDSLSRVHPQLRALVDGKYEGSLANYRNEFRRNMDLSLLFALAMWGLNIVDATVDGHLKGFDVGDDLSMKIKPVFMPGTLTPGISLVVNFK